jgi:hypothetical protein
VAQQLGAIEGEGISGRGLAREEREVGQPKKNSATSELLKKLN